MVGKVLSKFWAKHIKTMMFNSPTFLLMQLFLKQCSDLKEPDQYLEVEQTLPMLLKTLSRYQNWTVKYASDLEQKYQVSVWKQRVYVNSRRAAVWLFVGNSCSCRCFASFLERLLFFSFCELYFFLWTLIQYFSCVHLWNRDARKPIFCHFSRLKFVGKLGGSHSFVFGKYFI